MPDASADLRGLVLCAEGYSSSLAALRDVGVHRATDVIGGYAAWSAAVLPTVRGRTPTGGRSGPLSKGELPPPPFRGVAVVACSAATGDDPARRATPSVIELGREVAHGALVRPRMYEVEPPGSSPPASCGRCGAPGPASADRLAAGSLWSDTGLVFPDATRMLTRPHSVSP